jgi:GNAT superfamily N-acetyltransferase
MGTPYWKNRLATVADTDELLDLFHLEYGDKYPWFNKAYWQWRYQSQTGFAADVFVADFEGRLIGVLPQTLFDFQWGAQRLRGAMIYGLITHPDHRRKGVFRSLIGSCNEHAAQQGAQFSMGIPNDPSLPGYATFGGWEYLGLIHTHLKILNLPALLRGKTGRFLGYLLGGVPQLYFRRNYRPLDGPCADCELSPSAPDELTDVFDEFARDCETLMIRRTAPFWNWRYAAKPAAPYHMLIARQGGRVTGAVLTSVREHGGIQVGLVADLVCRGGANGMRQLLRHAEDDMRARGVGVLTCWATTPLLKHALDQERYWHPKPQRLGKNFHYIWRPTGVAGFPRTPSRLEDWHLSFSDSDNA